MNNKKDFPFTPYGSGAVSGTTDKPKYHNNRYFFCSYHLGNNKDFSSSWQELETET
jgi:hypothetical protein